MAKRLDEIKVTYIGGKQELFRDVYDYVDDEDQWCIEQRSDAGLRKLTHIPCRSILKVEVFKA